MRTVFTFLPSTRTVTQRLPPGRALPLILTLSPAITWRLTRSFTAESDRPPLLTALGSSGGAVVGVVWPAARLVVNRPVLSSIIVAGSSASAARFRLQWKRRKMKHLAFLCRLRG